MKPRARSSARSPRPWRASSGCSEAFASAVKPTLRTKLDSLVARRADLERQLAAEDATRDMERFRNQSREHSELSAIVSLYEQFQQAERDAEAARELVGDAQMKAFADDELKSARAAME